MKLGKIKSILLFLSLFLVNFTLLSDDKITTSPLINLENLKPSYEEQEVDRVKKNSNQIILKNKKKTLPNKGITIINLMGLDKITAKTSEVNIKVGEVKNFGLLEIKAIKCVKTKNKIKNEEVAYIQVKDLSDNQDEKIFVFNGWTFSSTPSLTPIDHPVYDIWLIGCSKA